MNKLLNISILITWLGGIFLGYTLNQFMYNRANDSCVKKISKELSQFIPIDSPQIKNALIMTCKAFDNNPKEVLNSLFNKH